MKLEYNSDQSSLLRFEIILNIKQYWQIKIAKLKLTFIYLNVLLYL